MNAAVLARLDLRLLWRHGFVLAYLVVSVVYLAALSALPQAWADAVLPVLAWSDPVFFAFFFAGATICLDLSQGTFRALFATPLSPAAYLVVKAADLSLLAFAMASVVSLGIRGLAFDPLALAAAALCGGAPAAVIGAALALRLTSVNRFMMGSIPVFLVLALPVAEYAAGPALPGWAAWLCRLSPGYGALRFALAAYGPVPAVELVLGAASSAVWTAAASVLALGPAAAAARGE